MGLLRELKELLNGISWNFSGIYWDINGMLMDIDGISMGFHGTFKIQWNLIGFTAIVKGVS